MIFLNKKMKVMNLFLILFLIKQMNFTSFNEVLSNLEILESYIKEYQTKTSNQKSLTHLIVSYIREGKYKGNQWTIAGGSVDSELISFIKEKDTEKKTNVESIRKLGDIKLPSNETLDFVHLFAVMNGLEFHNSYNESFANLVGWGGDTAQLFQDIHNLKYDNFEHLMNLTKEYFGHKGQFGEGDLISDLDAPILLQKKNDNLYFSDILRNYYYGEEYKKRIYNFVYITFPSLLFVDKNEFRNEIFKLYDNNNYINILECNYGLRDKTFTCYLPGKLFEQYTEHRKAAVYTFSDYLYDGLYESETNINFKKLLLFFFFPFLFMF